MLLPTKLQATLRLYIKYIYLPHILSPQLSFQLHTLKSSPVGILMSPIEYSVTGYIQTKLE